MQVRCLMCQVVSEQAEVVLNGMIDVRCPSCGVILRIVSVPRNVGRDEMPTSREHLVVPAPEVLGKSHFTAEVA